MLLASGFKFAMANLIHLLDSRFARCGSWYARWGALRERCFYDHNFDELVEHPLPTIYGIFYSNYELILYYAFVFVLFYIYATSKNGIY
jgi:hypothetical protein